MLLIFQTLQLCKKVDFLKFWDHILVYSVIKDIWLYLMIFHQKHWLDSNKIVINGFNHQQCDQGSTLQICRFPFVRYYWKSRPTGHGDASAILENVYLAFHEIGSFHETSLTLLPYIQREISDIGNIHIYIFTDHNSNQFQKHCRTDIV